MTRLARGRALRSPGRARRPGRPAAVLGLLALLAAGCAENAPMDTLDPEGPNARTIDNLINPVFIVAAVIFVLVEGMVLLFTLRYRHRDDAPEPVQVHGNT
ncbi:MAG TPA: hypothetical protein VHG90_08780, partial [Acidimicrobiales bacterium]|nr:hypothetical protein [Acidimicrobiales bacterium]